MSPCGNLSPFMQQPALSLRFSLLLSLPLCHFWFFALLPNADITVFHKRVCVRVCG